MKNSLRPVFRLMAAVEVIVGLVAVSLPFVVGPGELALRLGSSCARTANGGPEACTMADALGLFVGGGAMLTLMGLIGVVALRGDRPSPTLDLSGLLRR